MSKTRASTKSEITEFEELFRAVSNVPQVQLDGIERSSPALVKNCKAVVYDYRNDQRCIDFLSDIEVAKRRFDVWDIRSGSHGAVILHNLLPKDAQSRPEFLKIKHPVGSEISALGYGYLLVVNGNNLTRWHSDFDEATDCLITLHGAGRKLWLFCNPGKVASKFERFGATMPEIIIQMKTSSDKMLAAEQRVGDTIFFPYGWLHCVVTLVDATACSSLLAVGLKVPSERSKRTWETVTRTLLLNCRRWEKRSKGPDSD